MQSVPFSGEPLSGLQIMGILETRALDFKNIILLSVNEGILPSGTSSSSFIPFNLREAFGLPSINHQESVFAYHFYRLLHRAENVTFIYNSNPDGLKTGEMSRFLQQMKYEKTLKPEFLSSGFEIRNHEAIALSIERTEEHNRQLMSVISKKKGVPYLSATSLNTWLNCRMRFYYRYVNGLEEPERGREEIDPAMLGILLHDIMKNIYVGYIGRLVNSDEMEKILKGKEGLRTLIDASIRENFCNTNYSYTAGNELIIRDVLITYIERILNIDKSYAPFTILGVEESFSFRIPCVFEEKSIELVAGGRIDRIDVKDGITRIVDYKTGAVADSAGAISDLFEDDRDKDLDGWLQILFYSEGYLASHPDTTLAPSIYKVKRVQGSEGDDKMRLKAGRDDEQTVNDYSTVRSEYMSGLKLVLQTIFSKDEPFIMTEKQWNKCAYCPYRVLCKR